MAIRMSSALKNALLYNQPMISALSFGVIRVYSGPQPANANDSATGTLLGNITLDGLAFTPGATQGGLNMVAVPSFSYLIKPNSASWILTADTSGNAGWWRFHANANPAMNMDGSVTAPYEELFIGDPTLVAGETRNINSFQIGFYW